MSERLHELAAGFAAGELDGAESEELRSLLASASPEAKTESAAIVNGAAALALLLPRQAPSKSLKEKILSRTRQKAILEERFKFVWGSDPSGWIPLKRTRGAYVKVLSMSDDKDYAVVLGKLDPGVAYPAHPHGGPEEIYVLSGDLHIGDTVLHAGDFHHAAAGSEHGVNRSETGCMILAVLNKSDLEAQFARA